MRIRMALLLTLVTALFVSACTGSATEQPAPTNTPAPTVEQDTTPEPAAEVVETEQASTEEAPEAASEVTELPPGTVIARVSFPQSSARQGPGTNYGPVAQVNVNQEFPVIAMAGEGANVWYLVDLGDGQIAWLWARVVTITPQGATVEVAATVPAP